MNDQKRSIVVVLGMHRSGTSAITRGLQVIGVDLGDRLMAPAAGNNPKGFWEDIDLNALNVEMMNALQVDWHHLAPIEPSEVEFLRNKGYFLQAVALLQRKARNGQVYGFKDPRVAKLLPFWKEVLDPYQFDVTYVLTVRHPLSVVASLAARDGFEAEKSYLLWLGHTLATLTGTAGCNKRVLVDYDRLMESPSRELARINKVIGLGIDPAELHRYVNEFLDLGLRHTSYKLNNLLSDKVCPPIVLEIYRDLVEVAADRARLDDFGLRRKVEQWSEEFERFKSTLKLADSLFSQKVTALQAVFERDVQIASLKQVLAERDGQITSLKQGMDERDGQITNLKKGMDEREGQIFHLRREVENMRHSRSWRMTKPFRLLSAQLRGGKDLSKRGCP